MAAWRDDVRLPLAIDIFWEGAAGSCHKVLLERWSVTFAVEGESSSSGLSSTQDVIQQLKEVCKKISVLLRALFSFMRQLPAHRLFAQSYPSMLSYTIHAVPASNATRAFEAQFVATSGYAFIPIATPFGLLKVATVYRRDCSQFTEQQKQATPSRILQNNFIIQDYVPGSPDLVPASAPAPSWTRAVLAQLPTREAGSPIASFVPTSDAQLLRDDDVRDLPQCRSSPRSIPMSIAGSKQHFDSTGVDCKRTGEVAAVCHQPGVSQPMAIPRASIEGSIATAHILNAGTEIEYSEEKSGGILRESLISAKSRGFSPAFGDCGVTAWGISPTTPDLFSLALVGAEASVVGGQPRLLLSESPDVEGTNIVQGDGSSSEGLDMLLPFAIGDGSMTVASAFDTQSGSSPNCSSRLETAAVGAFLHQLKNAPKLSRSTCAGAGAGAGAKSGKLSSEGRDDISSQASLFDDELASFRSLRDELAQAL
uniref:Autophagy-related protein 13 N-terminal domain-containing protein n=1 Tax=Hyaloperonospora arabidopsidis (strain Emoy2) TaxID=559515 RepID=M4BIY2_HYAAE